MTINTSPADRALTAFDSAGFSKPDERKALRRAVNAYAAAGGIIAIYGPGDSWERPRDAKTLVFRAGRACEVKASISDYVRNRVAYMEAKAAKRAAEKAANV